MSNTHASCGSVTLKTKHEHLREGVLVFFGLGGGWGSVGFCFGLDFSLVLFVHLFICLF